MSDGGVTVAVVGSANLDVVVRCLRQPAPGETVLGDSIEQHIGGKGLNQAIAAARYAPVAFVGSVGDDTSANLLTKGLAAYGVDTAHTRRMPGSSGTALISVASTTGENSIIVISGVNAAVDGEQVISALEETQPKAVVAQLEIPTDAVVAAAVWADDVGARFVFNPSPIEALTHADAGDPIRSVLATADPLIVNLGEGVGILNLKEVDAEPQAVAEALGEIARSVVVTDGPRGAHVVIDGTHQFVPPTSVRAVDTTGAGDAFAGTVAALVSTGSSLFDAAMTAADVAAQLVAIPRKDRRPHL